MSETRVQKWPEDYIRGSKRTNLSLVGGLPSWDWFVGSGKDESCQFEGSWWDMICFARNVLSSENTRLVAPEFYRPDWRIQHYTEPGPYIYGPPAAGPEPVETEE